MDQIADGGVLNYETRRQQGIKGSGSSMVFERRVRRTWIELL